VRLHRLHVLVERTWLREFADWNSVSETHASDKNQ
jgi:hypothetical protein